MSGMPQIVLQLSRIATEEHVSLDSITPAAPVSYSGYQSVPMTIDAHRTLPRHPGLPRAAAQSGQAVRRHGLGDRTALRRARRDPHLRLPGSRCERDRDARRVRLHGHLADRAGSDHNPILDLMAASSGQRSANGGGSRGRQSPPSEDLHRHRRAGSCSSSSPSSCFPRSSAAPRPVQRPPSAPAAAAVPVSPSGGAAAGSSEAGISRAVAHLRTRDVFKPQISTSSGGGASAAVPPRSR